MCIFALCAPNSYSCTCVKPEIQEAFDEARAVFVGEVTEIVKPHTDNPEALPADRLYTVKFKVEKSWKGASFLDIPALEITILSDQGRGGCLSWGPFVKGERYLVYAEETKEKNIAVLFSCNRTASVTNAVEDLKELGKMSNSSFKYPSKPLSWLKN